MLQHATTILAFARVGRAMAQSEQETPRGPLPGDAPGTRQYLVELRNRFFDLNAVLGLIRTEPDPARRRQLMADLTTTAVQD